MAVQTLIDVLHQLIQLHEELIVLADRKKSALIENQVNEVSAIVNKESKILRAVDELLKRQAEATNAFFHARGFQPTRAVTVTELSRLVADSGQKGELLDARNRLAAAVERLKEANQLNQHLIEQSLSFINYSLDLMIGPDDEPVYRNPAEQQRGYGNKRSGYFDSRA